MIEICVPVNAACWSLLHNKQHVCLLWAQKTYESSILGRTNKADLPDASRAFEGQALLCSILQDGMRQGSENLVQHTSLRDQHVSIREVNYDFQDTGKPTEGSRLPARWALTFSRSSYDAIAMVTDLLEFLGWVKHSTKLGCTDPADLAVHQLSCDEQTK